MDKYKNNELLQKSGMRTHLINTKMIERKCGYRLTDRLQMNIVK